MTQPSRIVRFAVLAVGILFLDSVAFGQQSQSWKFPPSIPTTQSGYPSPVVASTGALAVGAYSITAKTSLQNLDSQREPSGNVFWCCWMPTATRFQDRKQPALTFVG